MPRHESSAVECLAQLLRGAALVLLLGAGLASIVGSGSVSNVDRSTSVKRPRVALLSADVAAVSFESVHERSNQEESHDLRTLLHSTSTGVSEALATHDAYTLYPDFSPIAMSAGRDGFAISLVAGSRRLGQDSNSNTIVLDSRRLQGCVHTLSSSAVCTPLQPASGEVVAVTHGQAGQALVLYGQAAALLERTYDHTSRTWGPVRAGPLFEGKGVDDLSVVRWRDGSLFLAGIATRTLNNATDKGATAVRYDPVSASWQSPAELGFRVDVPPKLALHPDAPTASPIAVWQPRSGGIAYSTWQDSQGWSAAAPIPGSTPGASRPTVAMWPNGDALVLWVAGPAGGRSIFASRRFGGAWEPPVTIGVSADDPKRIALGLDGAGNAVALWAGQGGTLMSANFLVSNGWKAATQIGFLADLTGSADLDVAMEPGGRAVAVWAEPAGGGQAGSQLKIAAVGPAVPPPTRRLTVTVSARGSDSVSSVPAGIACPGDCSQSYPLNQVVQLTAAPSTLVSGVVSRFRGWSGDPDCSDGSVTMDADKACTAEFTSIFDARQLTLTVTGNGRVTSTPASNVDCRGTCSALFGLGTGVALTATPDAGWYFARMTGADCSNTGVVMNADLACTAVFEPIAGTTSILTVYVQGSGTVVSAPAGIQCSGAAACPARFARNQVVVLTATPGIGQRFLGWAGDADCADGQVTLGADLTCVANFVATDAQWFTGAAALNQGSQFVGASILQPSIAVDAAGRPVVAWTEDEVVYLYRPFGAGVTQVSVNPRNGAASLLIEPSDGALVAFAEDTATERRNVRLRRYPASHAPGSVWTDVGPGPLDTTAAADARDPSAAIRNGRVTVAWVEGDAGVDLRIVVRSWDGTQWSAVGNGGGPAPNAATNEIERPRLVVTGAAPTQSLALVWREDVQFLRVVELVGDDWVATATVPYAASAQAGPFDMMWTADLGLVVAAAGTGGSLQVRQWLQGQWADVGTPRGDANPGSFVIDLAFSHGPADATPLLAHAVSRSRGAVQETLVERFVGGNWLRLGNALPAIDRHVRSASPRAVAVADHAQPEVAVVLQGVLPGTATTDRTLAVYRFE